MSRFRPPFQRAFRGRCGYLSWCRNLQNPTKSYRYITKWYKYLDRLYQFQPCRLMYAMYAGISTNWVGHVGHGLPFAAGPPGTAQNGNGQACLEVSPQISTVSMAVWVKSVPLPRNIERSEEYVVFADAFKQVWTSCLVVGSTPKLQK